MADISKTMSNLLLKADSKLAAAKVSKDMASQGVGTEAQVSAAKAESVALAAQMVKISPESDSLRKSQSLLSGLATREINSMAFTGLQTTSVDQKTLIVSPVRFEDRLKDTPLPRSVKVQPVIFHWDEDGVLFIDGVAQEHSTVTVAVKPFTYTVNHQLGALEDGKAGLHDITLGFHLLAKTFNLNRGNGRIEGTYAQGGLDLGLFSGTLSMEARFALLRYAAGNTYSTAVTSAEGVVSIGGSTANKSDNFELLYPDNMTRGPLATKPDKLTLAGANLDLWIRPILLTEATAPAVLTAIQDPGTDLADFLLRSY